MGLPHMQYAQKTNSEHELQFGMNPCSYISFFCGWTDEQRGFQARPGGWTSPQPRERGCPFPGEWPSFRPIPFVFVCFFFLLFFLFFPSVFCDFWRRSILNWRSPIWIRDLPGRLATCPLVPPSPPFLSLPLPSPPFPSLPLPSPSPSPRPQVSRLRALVFLTSSPLARELCFAHVLCKRRGPWSEPDLSAGPAARQLHATCQWRVASFTCSFTYFLILLGTAHSLLKFHVSLVFCADFYYPVQVDLLFRLCCMWHVPFSQVAFFAMFFHKLCVSASNLPLFFPIVLHLSPVPLSRLSSFATVSSLRLTLFNAFVLQLLFSPFWNLHFSIPFFCNRHFCLSQTYIFHSHFFAIVIFAFLKLAFVICIFLAFDMFAFLWIAFFNPIFLHCFCSFFRVENILEQAQFDSTTVLWPMQMSESVHVVSMHVWCWLHFAFGRLPYWCVTSLENAWNQIQATPSKPTWSRHEIDINRPCKLHGTSRKSISVGTRHATTTFRHKK